VHDATLLASRHAVGWLCCFKNRLRSAKGAWCDRTALFSADLYQHVAHTCWPFGSVALCRTATSDVAAGYGIPGWTFVTVVTVISTGTCGKVFCSRAAQHFLSDLCTFLYVTHCALFWGGGGGGGLRIFIRVPTHRPPTNLPAVTAASHACHRIRYHFHLQRNLRRTPRDAPALETYLHAPLGHAAHAPAPPRIYFATTRSTGCYWRFPQNRTPLAVPALPDLPTHDHSAFIAAASDTLRHVTYLRRIRRVTARQRIPGLSPLLRCWCDACVWMPIFAALLCSVVRNGVRRTPYRIS